MAIGITQTVVRTIVPAAELVEKPDGTVEIKSIPRKVSVSYGFGGIPPLNLEEAFTANFEQYNRARACYESYRTLLAVGMSNMPLIK